MRADQRAEQLNCSLADAVENHAALLMVYAHS